jgi:hypothetical protein
MAQRFPEVDFSGLQLYLVQHCHMDIPVYEIYLSDGLM